MLADPTPDASEIVHFPCPKCGHETRITDTRSRQGWLWRRRRCQWVHCQHRFSTHEKINFWLSRYEGFHADGG